MRNRPRSLSALALLAPAAASGLIMGQSAQAQSHDAPAATAHVVITVTGLRNTRGLVRACMTTDAKGFPDCQKDPTAYSKSVKAAEGMVIDFGPVRPGRYGIALLHDENENGKVDKLLMVPKEGFGFSRDAKVRMGPPRFDEAAIDVGTASLRTSIRMRYLL